MDTPNTKKNTRHHRQTLVDTTIEDEREREQREPNMDRDLLHKTATRIAPAGEVKNESSNSNGDGFGKAAGQSKAASNNGHAPAAATNDSNNGDTRTPKKRRKVNHGEFWKETMWQGWSEGE